MSRKYASYLKKLKIAGVQSRTAWLMGTDSDDSDGEYDVEAWEMLSKGLKEVQRVLEENRLLIQQVNENHESKIHDNLVKNVALIQEINGNVSKIRTVYSSISVNLCHFVRRRSVKNDNVT
ncbi:putative protein EARLY FLOWERING 4 [Helianthus annuus]|nr:putative protein EARLY FLOWERING 4 [Helianthus annuus]